MLINFVDVTNDANHYTKPPPIANLFMNTRIWYMCSIMKYMKYSIQCWRNGRSHNTGCLHHT